METRQLAYPGITRWDRLVLALSNPRFVYLTVIAFIVVGIAFALFIRWGTLITTHLGVVTVHSDVVVPDEDRHLGSILYYVNRGWWRGPVITDFDVRYLVLGELQRTPSYLFFWVMSIPVSALHLITDNYDVTVVFVRLVDVAIGAFGLLVLWKTLLLARVNPAIAALAILGLSLTGRYLWQSAGVSYDIPSTVLFFLFLYACVAVLVNNSTLQLLLMLMWAALVSITKDTFLPFAAVGAVIIVVLYLLQNRPGPWRHLGREITAGVRQKPARFLATLVILVAAAALFCERIFGNLLVYRAIEPSCAAVHPVAACTQWAIYRRNAKALRTYADSLQHGGHPAQFSPFTFTGEWLDRYYKSLFFYYGRTTGNTISSVTLVIIALVIAVVIAFFLVNRSPLLVSREMKFIGLLGGLYFVGTYIVNLKTYLTYDQYFAFQGRYLLPFIAIVYVVLITLIASNWRRVRGRWRWILGVPLVLLLAVVFVSHLSVIGFFEYARGTKWESVIALALESHL